MDTLSSSSRPRNYDILKPEADLAEWTNRIKALQRQVDADDEAEQRQLEEEIVAARKARLRRSRGPESVELPRVSSETPNLATRSDSGHTVIEREVHAVDASKRFISGRPNVESVIGSRKPLSQNSNMSSQKRSEPMSLAAFMGGRATGPRLNKHAPQQDATDPTQFEQHTNIVAPHPIFGRGGIAMPGLVGQRPSTVRFQESSNVEQISVVANSHTPPVSKRHDGKAVERAVTPQETKGNVRHSTTQNVSGTQFVVTQATGIEEGPTIPQKLGLREPLVFPQTSGSKEQLAPYQNTSIRERATSTPAGTYSRKDADRPSSRSSERKISQFQGIGASTPNSDRYTPSPSPSAAGLVHTRHSPRPSYATPIQKSPAVTAYLARPIQPEPRSPPQSNVVSSSILPSPAFMKPPAPKELTPSISRLQGRGFVQSMVKISSQLESPTPVSSSPTSKSRAPRKSSVLDRWQPAMASNTTPSPSESVSTHSSTTTTGIPRPSSAEPDKKFLRTRASLPSISQGLTEVSGVELERNASLLRKMPPDGAPGLGSATTMAIYKPSPSPVETEFSTVDELGMRKGPASAEDAEKTRVPTEFHPPSAKPLSHPTKGRAKKPRKVKDVQSAIKERDKPSAINLVRNQSRATAKTHTSFNLSTTAAKATDLQAMYRPMTIHQHIEAVELPIIDNAYGFRSIAPGSETTLVEASPIKTSATSFALPDQTKRTSRIERALPGSAVQHEVVEATSIAVSPEPPSSLHKRLREAAADDQHIHAAVRHPRFRAAGSRPTVMDVAFTFSQRSEDDTTTPDTQILNPVTIVDIERKPEKRKSALDKYSSIMLPTLKEEVTPSTSPIGTLSISLGNSQFVDNTVSDKRPADLSGLSTVKVVHLEDYGNKPLPDINVDHLLESQPHIELSNPSIQTISVEVLNIIGAGASAISKDANIFYDTEVLAVVHRYKSKIDGLVSTNLWIWRGKQSQTNDKEEHKIQELARRYGTSAKLINQYSEPPQLVFLLGGRLAIRQGTRSRWTSENTTMHLIRQHSGVIYIDELDLSVRNLCSAFSYCLSVLNTIYVWYGCGSNQAERQATSEYAQVFLPEGQSLVELHEGENDNDEIFWMMLGGEDYAKADYWKWRKEAPKRDPIVWRVQTETDPVVTLVPIMPPRASFHEEVYIIDCIWEFFVLVGSKARGRRQDIRFGLFIASKMSKRLSPSRPFPPTVHVLVLPSQLPSDLRLNFRNFDEAFLNDDDIPDHMNLLSATEASEHLRKTSWDIENLKDKRMLPLGVDISHVPRYDGY